MFKFFAFVAMIVVSCSIAAQGTLSVASGTTTVINPNYDPLLLDGLVMEDNSTLIIRDLPEWRVQIREINIGNNCRINLAGQDGKDADQKRHDNGGTADYCDGGDDYASAAGLTGGHGTTGPDLVIVAGIKSIGDLTIVAAGGNGGKGGLGGKGEKGGQARCTCSAGGGAKGGRGGNGGAGGRRANVAIYWYPIPGGSPVASATAGLKIVGDPGKGGSAGPSGPGGDGGDGACGHGHAGGGWPGDPGNDGVDGTRSDDVVRLISADSVKSLVFALGLAKTHL